MPSSRDPRSYVRPVPLPFPTCKGVKLLARDTLNFNPELPSREDVRKNNYNRRQTQMSLMGFQSLNHKPYVGIGDPFYLDEKKMILHALGQWNEEEISSSSSDDEEDEEGKESKQQPAFTAAKFVLRRSRKDLNTLNKAVVHGRNMIRNVRLGHGLFDLITKEKQDKKAASEAALRRRQEQLRNEFQPPKAESDEETEDDMENDVDLANIARAEEEEEFQRARSAMVTSQMTSALSRPVSSRKKKQQTPRPYTPQHTNISTTMSVRESSTMDTDEQEFDLSKDALFRQLCVLHWILEAMSSDSPSAMTAITSCWSLSEIGGSKAQQKKLQRDKATETGWATFVSKEPGRIGKRLSTQRASRSPHARRALHGDTRGRNSVMSSGGGSQQGSATGLNTPASQGHGFTRNRLVSDENDHHPPQEEEEDQAYNKSIFKFLDEYYESLKYEEEQKKNKDEDSKSTSSSPPTSPTPEKKEKRSKEMDDKRNKKSKKKKDKEKGEDNQEKRLDHKVAVALGEEEKMSSKFLRANAHFIRPKSSQALIDFQTMLPSNKKAGLCTDLQNKFAECREERALTLHDILDHKESQRMVVCQSKFSSLTSFTRGSSFHRAVDSMRTQSWQSLRKPVSDRKKSSAKGNWYTELVEKIPQDLRQEWYYGKIIQKLGNFGLVEGTGKQSIYKFLKVLQGLREWEICSPDVTAAVEFCREHIVEMTVEEYEWWFKQQFPKVTRPHTAPPASKTEKKGESNGTQMTSRASRASTSQLVRSAVPRRAVQSAFARRAQH